MTDKPLYPFKCTKCDNETYLITKPFVGLVYRCINCKSYFDIIKISQIPQPHDISVIFEAIEISQDQVKELVKSGVAERYDASREE